MLGADGTSGSVWPLVQAALSGSAPGPNTDLNNMYGDRYDTCHLSGQGAHADLEEHACMVDASHLPVKCVATGRTRSLIPCSHIYAIGLVAAIAQWDNFLAVEVPKLGVTYLSAYKILCNGDGC